MKTLLVLATLLAHHNFLYVSAIANPSENPVDLPLNDTDPWTAVVDAGSLHLRDRE